MQLSIFPGNAPISLDLGQGGSTVTNHGLGTVVYTGGTIVSGASITLFGVQQFSVTTTRASVQIEPSGIGVIRLEDGPSLFIGAVDPGVGAANGDVWIDTSG